MSAPYAFEDLVPPRKRRRGIFDDLIPDAVTPDGPLPSLASVATDATRAPRLDVEALTAPYPEFFDDADAPLEALRADVAARDALLGPHRVTRAGDAQSPNIPIEQADLDRNPLIAGATAGFAGDLSRQAGNVAQILGLDQLGERMIQRGEYVTAKNPARVPSLGDVEGLGDAADYAGYQVGRGLASTVPSLAAATAATAAGGGAPLAMGAAAIPSYIQNVGDIREELGQQGAEGISRDLIALSLGLPVAALDAIVPTRAAGVAAQGLGEVAQRGVRPALGRIGREAGIEAGQEGLTEAAQEGLQYTGVQAATGNRFDWGEFTPRVAEAAVAGALTGGVMGGGVQATTEGVDALARRPGAPPDLSPLLPPEPPAAPAATVPEPQAVSQLSVSRETVGSDVTDAPMTTVAEPEVAPSAFADLVPENRYEDEVVADSAAGPVGDTLSESQLPTSNVGEPERSDSGRHEPTPATASSFEDLVPTAGAAVAARPDLMQQLHDAGYRTKEEVQQFSPEERAAYVERARAIESQLDELALGPEVAQTFARAHRAADGALDPGRAREAGRIIEAIEAAMAPAQREVVFGIGRMEAFATADWAESPSAGASAGARPSSPEARSLNPAAEGLPDWMASAAEVAATERAQFDRESLEARAKRIARKPVAKLTDDELVERYRVVFTRMEKALDNMASGKVTWTRYDDDIGEQRSGEITRSIFGRAKRRAEQDAQILDALEVELTKRDLSEAAQFAIDEVDERAGMQDEGGDTTFRVAERSRKPRRFRSAADLRAEAERLGLRLERGGAAPPDMPGDLRDDLALLQESAATLARDFPVGMPVETRYGRGVVIEPSQQSIVVQQNWDRFGPSRAELRMVRLNDGALIYATDLELYQRNRTPPTPSGPTVVREGAGPPVGSRDEAPVSTYNERRTRVSAAQRLLEANAGAANIVGARFATPEERFTALRPWRHPSKETLHFLGVTSEGVVAVHHAYTSDMPGVVGFEDAAAAAAAFGRFVREARDRGVTAAFLAHNHPNGDTSPSPEDLGFTAATARALAGPLAQIGIEFAGHTIVGDDEVNDIRVERHEAPSRTSMHQLRPQMPWVVPASERWGPAGPVMNGPLDVARVTGGRQGVLFLDANSAALAFLPMDEPLLLRLAAGHLDEQGRGWEEMHRDVAATSSLVTVGSRALFDRLAAGMPGQDARHTLPHAWDVLLIEGGVLSGGLLDRGYSFEPYFYSARAVRVRRVREKPRQPYGPSGPAAGGASAAPERDAGGGSGTGGGSVSPSDAAPSGASVRHTPRGAPPRQVAASPGRSLYGVSDPLSAALAVAKELRQRHAERDRESRPLATSLEPEVEKRFQAAKGLPTPTLGERIRHALQELAKTRRHFVELDPRASETLARANTLLLEIEHAPAWAATVARDEIRSVVKDLTPGELDTFTRLLVLPDILKDIESGLYTGKDLPFGYADEAAVRADLDRFEQAATPAVRTATERRQAFAQRLSRQLVARQLLAADVLDDPRYYHRQVLEHVQMLGAGLGQRDVRVHRKGFQKQRVGGGDFNTRYQEAEFEWVSQAVRLIHLQDALKEIKALTDIAPDLKAEADQQNEALFIERSGGADPREAIQERIAQATDEVLQYVASQAGNALAGFEDVAASLIEARVAWAKKSAEGKAFRFQHPLWRDFLHYLVASESPAAPAAATVLRGVRARERMVEETLGKDYVAWQDQSPEDYTAWQPVRGNYFFPALTLGERAAEAIMAGERELMHTDLREALMLGGPRETWAIPEGLAVTMDRFGAERAEGPIDKAWTRLLGYVKTWFLLSPRRLLTYNFNNLVGDADGTFVYPGIQRFAPQAARDLWDYMVRQSADPALTAELQEALRRRVLDSGITLTEIPDLNQLPEFAKLRDADPIGFMKLVSTYFRHARLLTTWRENTLRLAAYRYFQDRMARGDVPLAASDPRILRAQKNPKDRAAMLARDLVGDYGNISTAGTFVRQRAILFYSWLEVNAKRYFWLFRNIPQEGAGASRAARIGAALGARVAIGTALRAAWVAAAVHVFFALTNAWNYLMFPDEEDELRKQGRRMHLILGRREDGTIIAVRIEGAWADMLKWIGLDDAPADVQDVLAGEASLGDKFVDAMKAPVERVVNSLEPISKTVLELASGRSFFPSVFNPRPIRDKVEYVARLAQVEWLYQKVTDRPIPRGRPLGGMVPALQTDTGEAAYYHVRELAGQYLERQGKGGRGATDPTERDNALYYWRKSLAWGEAERAERWRQRYLELGGTPAGMRQSLRRAAPLGFMSRVDRARFVSTLSEEDRRALEMADQWYRGWLGTLKQSREAAGTR